MKINILEPSTFPSAYLPEKIKKASRFMLIGAIGSFVQTGFFLLVMLMMHEPAKETIPYYVAFVLGFVLEMIPNYFCTCWYTFEARPNKTNLTGFVLARAANLVIQLLVLPLAMVWLKWMGDGLISMIVIFVAGIVNFLIQYFFFKTPKKVQEKLKQQQEK